MVDHGIDLLDCPQSPDMNPIENLWDELFNIMSKKEKPTSLDDLFYKLSDAWYSIPQEYCEKLVSSMPRRVEALYKSRGGPTKY